MRLLPKKEVTNRLSKENDELVDRNIRLRKLEKDILKRLDTIKEDYTPEKIKRLKEFENFVRDITEKKSKLLEELNAVGKMIEQKKETYYAMINANDALEEKLYKLKEQEKKLDLRQTFVEDLEEKFRAKQT